MFRPLAGPGERIMSVAELFGQRPLIGVIHLPPLPGAPAYEGGGVDQVVERALADLDELQEGGAAAAIVENLGDAPFAKRADKATVAFLSVVAREVCRASRIPIGVNVLRSDGEAALAVAAAAGATFIRVNVFCGVAFTDQGMIEGDARIVLSLRRSLRAPAVVLADVHVKHAAHLGPLSDAARDAARNGADGVVITGGGTGEVASPEDVRIAKRAAGLPVFVGSGITADNVVEFAAGDGFIVGSWLKRGGVIGEPVDSARVRLLIQAVQGLH